MLGYVYNHVGHASLSMNNCLNVFVIAICCIKYICMNIWLLLNKVDLLVTNYNRPTNQGRVYLEHDSIFMIFRGVND